MSQALARQVNQHLQLTDQLLGLAEEASAGVGQGAITQAALMMFERSVVLYLWELLPKGKGVSALDELSLTPLIKKVVAQADHSNCAEWIDLYRQPGSWLQELVEACAVKLAAGSIQGAFFDSDLEAPTSVNAKSVQPALIASSGISQKRYDWHDIRVWKKQFVALVERQRHENEEY